MYVRNNAICRFAHAKMNREPKLALGRVKVVLLMMTAVMMTAAAIFMTVCFAHEFAIFLCVLQTILYITHYTLMHLHESNNE